MVLHQAQEGFGQHGERFRTGEMGRFFDDRSELHKGFHKAALSAQTELLAILDNFLGGTNPNNIKYN